MTEMIVDTQAVSEVILSRISTEKVKIAEDKGVIILTPLSDEKATTDESEEDKKRYPWKHLVRGKYAGILSSVDEFLRRRHEDKELEEELDRRRELASIEARKPEIIPPTPLSNEKATTDESEEDKKRYPWEHIIGKYAGITSVDEFLRHKHANKD